MLWLTRAGAGEIVVITPHIDAIRYEFGRGFAAWHARQYGETAEVEWRNTGGTADALRFVQSEFAAKPDGIGLDCFFGGGQEPYLVLADKGLSVAYRPPDEILRAIPRQISGVYVYDPNFTWFGAALSSFGILQNLRVQQLMGLPPAKRWEDLARPELSGWVGAGDPRNSGTMNVMYEAFLQYYGWEKGWRMLTEIGGNTRLFDRVFEHHGQRCDAGGNRLRFRDRFLRLHANRRGGADEPELHFTPGFHRHQSRRDRHPQRGAPPDHGATVH